MFKLIFCLVCASVTVSPSSSCLQCFVDPNDAVRMCWGYIIIEHDVRNIGECMRMVDRIFNHNKTVMDAGRVGRGHDQKLKDIMLAQIMPMVEEFDQKTHDENVYEARLRAAAEHFIAQASQLPRASGCVPPCGFQVEGSVYSCRGCQYESCEYPLDCPGEG
ncbi:sperm acrosome membrane-associated protein 6-like [Clupea harengus]|uniref:Sperm acrosome membrane-associated protein 6-like n=1 Tax=Clupea harengus TaxID=7950 RepID=A0A8M1KMS0_CLUHA|nr:sperm acrosome membrane-associated protein 6-like [Clupea harengus]